jgi:hypothetical protein
MKTHQKDTKKSQSTRIFAPNSLENADNGLKNAENGLENADNGLENAYSPT